MLFTGAFDPGRGCTSPSGLCATRLLLTGAFDPGRGCASPSGLRATRFLLTGAFDPGRGCASPSGLCATRLLLTGAFDPGRRCASPSGLCSHKDCYIPGPSTPAESVPALRAYEPQDAIYRGLRPRQRVYPALRAFKVQQTRGKLGATEGGKSLIPRFGSRSTQRWANVLKTSIRVEVYSRTGWKPIPRRT
jgi:hypothetical protein